MGTNMQELDESGNLNAESSHDLKGAAGGLFFAGTDTVCVQDVLTQ
jgi:hypothetical protein